MEGNPERREQRWRERKKQHRRADPAERRSSRLSPADRLKAHKEDRTRLLVWDNSANFSTGAFFAGSHRDVPEGLPLVATVAQCSLSLQGGLAVTVAGGRVYVSNVAGQSVSMIATDRAPTTAGIPLAGHVGQPASRTFTTKGQPVPTVTVTADALPAGLTLTPAGVLSGTHTTAGRFELTVTAAIGVGDDVVCRSSSTSPTPPFLPGLWGGSVRDPNPLTHTDRTNRRPDDRPPY